ncbi:MAG: RES domain-containing protein [Rhodospirillales bacterium]|nr:RES domain-containing protein [Rhodospirillales bacterium]
MNSYETFAGVDAFQKFSREVALCRRYLRSPGSERFLRAVAATCEERLRPVAAGETFWRAQIGHGWVHDTEAGRRMRGPHPETRMKPLPDRASEGRINPKGIPCLYFATTREVAMSEVRPWIGSFVSVGRFQTTRGLIVADCSLLHDYVARVAEHPSPAEIEKIVWANIDRAFSRPVTRSDDTAEYAATQVLAELFRAEGYDGVMYGSALSANGKNVALFDLGCAEQVDSAVFTVRRASFEFDEVAP